MRVSRPLGGIVAAIFVSAFAAMFLGPLIAVVILRGPVLEWFRIMPTWRRAARRRPTRVLHGVLLPTAARDDGSVIRTVHVRTENVLPVLRLAFVEGAGEWPAGPVALELFAGDRVAGPVRVSVADRAEWAYHVVVGGTEVESPSLEVDVELGGPLTSPSLESYAVAINQPSGRGVPLAPAGDGFGRARRAALGRPWRLVVVAVVSVLSPVAFVVLMLLDAADLIPEESATGSLDADNPWHLAVLIAIMLLFASVGYYVVRRGLTRLLRVRPAWRRAARQRPTLAVHGVMLSGTRPVGRYGARTVLPSRFGRGPRWAALH